MQFARNEGAFKSLKRYAKAARMREALATVDDDLSRRLEKYGAYANLPAGGVRAGAKQLLCAIQYPRYASDLMFLRGKLDASSARSVASKLLSHLDILHSKGVCHHDIKLPNLCLMENVANVQDMDVRIADWGFLFAMTGSTHVEEVAERSEFLHNSRNYMIGKLMGTLYTYKQMKSGLDDVQYILRVLPIVIEMFRESRDNRLEFEKLVKRSDPGSQVRDIFSFPLFVVDTLQMLNCTALLFADEREQETFLIPHMKQLQIAIQTAADVFREFLE
jgi:hypothetical protein